MKTRIREYTCKIIEMVDEGVVDRDTLIRDLLMYMSESEVQNFYDQYYGYEEEDDELNGFDEQSAWYDTSAELM